MIFLRLFVVLINLPKLWWLSSEGLYHLFFLHIYRFGLKEHTINRNLHISTIRVNIEILQYKVLYTACKRRDFCNSMLQVL